MIGIYKITDTINNKVYIGQSINIKNRISYHKTKLKYNKHHNDYLQRAYNKYRDGFKFDILETCEKQSLDELEIYYIKLYKSTNRKYGYNFDSGGNANKDVSEETRNKMRGKNNPMYGKKQSKDVKNKIKLSNRGKNNILNEQCVIKIKESYIEGYSINYLSKIFGVDITTINKITRLRNWTYVREDLNDACYNREKNRKKKRDKQILSLFSQGKLKCEISKELKVHHTTINKVLKQANTEVNW